MSIIIDLIVIAIIALFVIISAKKGFVKVLVSTVGFVAAIVVAFSLSDPLSTATYDKLIEPVIIKAVSQGAAAELDSAASESWNALPDFIKNNAEKIGLSEENYSNSITENTSGGVEQAVTTASKNVLRPIVVKILVMIYSVILVIVLLFIVNILSNLINKLFSFSLAGKLNHTFGGILGLVKGLVIALLFCMIITTIISFTSKGFWIFTNENIEGTYVFKSLAGLIPFKLF